MIEVTNHGPLIVASNYWGSEYDRGGKIFASVNAGCIRLLIPSAHRTMIEECRSSKYAVLSRGPWPEQRLADAVEILFEDGTDSPFALHLSPTSFDMLPAEPEPGREWTITLWTAKKGVPHRGLERVCHWRRVASLPCLEPWAGGGA